MRLYVGNLQWLVTDADLQELFSTLGEVTQARIVREPETNRSRGFGFVAFATREQGELAVKQMDNYELKGRPIRVSEARERPPRPRY